MRIRFRLNHERNEHAQQENESQQMISSLQKKIAEMIKQHTKSMDEIKRELHQERLAMQKQLAIKPISIPQFVQVEENFDDRSFVPQRFVSFTFRPICRSTISKWII